MLRCVLPVCLALLTQAAWAPVARAMPLDQFIEKGRQVIAIARAQGLGPAEHVFADPARGFVALDGPGLHVWATTAKGVIVFDLSGQAAPGTDLSKWTNEDGVNLMDAIGHAIDSPGGTLISRFKGVPHPKTNQVMDVDFWCGRLSDGAIVCATFWPDAH